MKVFISRPIPENAYEILRSNGLDIEINPENTILSKEELIEKIKDKDILLSLLTDKIDEEVLSSNPNLKLVSNYAVGFNNVDITSATKNNILITNTPGVLDNTTADLGFTLLMSAARQILQADTFTREGKFDKWEPLGFLGEDIHHATLGIVGAGRIGQAMAKRGHKGFDMNILYSDPYENDYLNNELKAKKVELNELLEKSDFVSLHVPLLDSTHHLISTDQLKLMKKSAILINTSRGPVIDEIALVEALKTGEIKAAGLDVYENEPEVNSGLIKLDNAVLVPHIASASIKTRGEMARIAAENIVAFAKGEKPQAMVNPEILN